MTNQRQRAGVAPRAVGRSLQEVGDSLDQEVSVFEVGEQEVHFVLGADGHGAWQDAAAVCLLHDGHLRSRESWVKPLIKSGLVLKGVQSICQGSGGKVLQRRQ